MLSEIALGKILDAALEPLKKHWGAREEGIVSIEVKDPTETLADHNRMIFRWASEISFRDLGVAKQTRDSFVDLDLHLGPASSSPLGFPIQTLRVSDISNIHKNVVILGDPGAGKTTSVKRIALDVLSKSHDRSRPLLLVLLREYSEAESLTKMLLHTLGLVIKTATDLGADQRKTLERSFLLKHLSGAGFTVLLDGLDEIRSEIRETIVEDLRFLIRYSERTQFILTCRKAEYRYSLDQLTVLSILPLSTEQIQEFTERWLGKRESETFREQIKEHPYSGSEVRPLTLAHLCAIYERSGKIPERPRTVYRKIVRLLLEEWDEQRSVRRFSRFADFEIDRKEEFLEAIAYQLTMLGHQGGFSLQALESAYAKVYSRFSLAPTGARLVVRELEAHTGLILESGYENFEFPHRSIQEYLTASHALRLPEISSHFIKRFPNEAAMAITLSARPNDYLALFLQALLEQGAKRPIRVILDRLRVERADFYSSPEFGKVLLRTISGLISRADIQLLNHDTKETLNAVTSFAGLLQVAESLGSVLAYVKVVSRKGAHAELMLAEPWTGAPQEHYGVPVDVIHAVNRSYPLPWLIERLAAET